MKEFKGIFENKRDLSQKNAKRELSGMKNSQPPKSPTFIINQQQVKDVITQKLTDCLGGEFTHVVLTGKIGGGKTHFLNWLESSLSTSSDFYIVRFQVQEANVVKNSFVRMVVSKIFQVYYSEFSNSFKRLVKKIKIEDLQNKDDAISSISEKLGVTTGLATLLHTILIGEKNSGEAMRILGASHGRTEINRLRLRELNNTDYINVIKLFLEHRERHGFLLILLDEFEHASSVLTVAARRNFFVSYKEFVDSVPNFEEPFVSLVTSVTEQYEGKLKEDVSKNEAALWSRLRPNIIELIEFNPSNVKEFEELFNHLSKRYEIAYDYDIGIEYPNEMKKQFMNYLGVNSTQAISYRDAITNMLNIMDELRRQKQTLEDIHTEKGKQAGIDLRLDKASPEVKTDQERVIEEVKAKWLQAHHNTRPGMIKTTLEKIFLDSQFKIVRMKELGFEELSSLLYVSSNENEKLIYIAPATNPKSVVNKFQRCIKQKDSMSSKGIKFNTIFIYQKEAETSTVKKYLSTHPDIVNIALEAEELYDLLAYSSSNTEVLKELLLKKLNKVVENLI